MFTGDTYLQPDAADPVLGDDRILELARRHVATLRSVSAVDESGGEARAYICDDDIVVKTQRPNRLRPRTSLEKEVFVLGCLAANADVAIPRVLGYGSDDDIEYIVMTRVPGVALENAALDGSARRGALGDLGATLRRIHEVDQAEMESSPLIPGDRNAADLRDRLASGFEALSAAVAPDGRFLGIDLRRLAEVCLSGLPASLRPVTLHSNPGSEHCFVDPDTGRFTGLIDFGDAYRSHPALDLRSWSSLDDSQHLLDGYRSLGALPEGFGQVRRCGIILTELRLVARARRDRDEVAHTIRALLEGDGDS